MRREKGGGVGVEGMCVGCVHHEDGHACMQGGGVEVLVCCMTQRYA